MKAEGAPSTKWTGFIFGSPKEIYLAHWIGSKPNFDQIAKIKTQHLPTLSAIAQKLQSDMEVLAIKDPGSPLNENLKNTTTQLEGEKDKGTAQIEKQIYFNDEDFQN